MSEALPFASVGLVGLGVMGGSLARALSASAAGIHVKGWSADAHDVRAALDAGALTQAATSLEECVDGVDLVVVAVPVDATRALLPGVGSLTGPGTVIHDVASLKGPVHETALAAGIGDRWVGGHPMAGSEASGFGASRADLYRDARVWLTAEVPAADALDRVRRMWQTLGAAPQGIDPREHDRLMALASHLPQLTANALARVIQESGLTSDQLGPGGRDATRLAASSPDMWAEILAQAPDELPQALRRLSEEAAALATALEEGDLTTLRALMEVTRAWRTEA